MTTKQIQKCEAFGSRCTLCGSHFGDTVGPGDICSGGGHEYGRFYELQDRRYIPAKQEDIDQVNQVS